MSTLETAAALLQQWMEASTPDETTGVDPTPALLGDLAAILPDDDTDMNDDPDVWAKLDAAIAHHRNLALAAADDVRRSCQMTGHAVVDGVTIRPNGEFICQTGPADIKAQSLTGWPTAPSWYLQISSGTHSEQIDADDADSWWDLVQLVRERAAEWRADDAHTQAAHRARIQDAERELAAAYAQVAEKRAALNALRRDTTGAGDVEPDLIAAWRHRLGLTLDDLAHELGVNPRTTRAWIQGRSKPGAWLEPAIDRLLAAHDRDVATYLATGELPQDRPQGWRIAVIADSLASHHP